MIFSGMTDEELYAEALKLPEAEADSGMIPALADPEAEATMFAVCAALSTTQAAYAYASEALDPVSPESSRELAREVLAVSSTYAKMSAAECKRLRTK